MALFQASLLRHACSGCLQTAEGRRTWFSSLQIHYWPNTIVTFRPHSKAYCTRLPAHQQPVRADVKRGLGATKNSCQEKVGIIFQVKIKEILSSISKILHFQIFYSDFCNYFGNSQETLNLLKIKMVFLRIKKLCFNFWWNF